ncbi:MAG TPA: glycosyltransferase, partial [Ilumatobacteraceae bacterium]
MSLDWLLGPQLRAFKDAGYEVIGMSAPGEHVANLTAMGIPHVPIHNFTRAPNVVSDAKAFVEMLRALRRLRPDIVHTHNPKPGILGRVATRLVGVPLVVNTQHGLYAQPDDPRKRRWAVYTVERFAAAFGDVELVQNPEDADTLVTRLRVPARRVKVLGNGVDLSRFDPDTVDAGVRDALRGEWGVGEDDVVCGIVGRLVIEKGTRELFAAAAALRAEGSAARFVVIGPSEPDKPDGVDAAAIAAAERDGVVFLGRRTDMPELYSAMDLFVTATYREGFPRAAMEAAAMGLPIVATNIRGCRQVVDDGLTGVLVPVRDAQALGAAVGELVS